METDSKPFFIKLPKRGLIQIEGDDRYEFLHKLISNDIKKLNKDNALYACLLTPQGKFLHDFFVLEGPDVLLLDCEGGKRAEDLYNRLNLYRLRAKVKISVEPNDVYAIFGKANSAEYPDPRHPAMGKRSFQKPEVFDEEPFEKWDRHRIRLGIPDGSRDMVPEQSTLLECNIDRFNGICFDKGCYVGQELTARMHHRGLCKKHLYTIEGESLPAPESDIRVDDALAGQMRSSCGNLGLALLKDDMLDKLSGTSFRLKTPGAQKRRA